MNLTIIEALRMERQFLIRRAGKEEYMRLYRDIQPVQNVYWNGFGDPPSISFRADFDDIAFNRLRQENRELIKGRFAGTIGWIIPEDLELFAALYRKPLINKTDKQQIILDLIEREGPLNIQQIKQETGFLVKHITLALHRLQEAFLVYEDQYDGEWDRGWYRFSEMFPDVRFDRYTKMDALKIILKRFGYRMVAFDCEMAKSFYRLPAKEINAAIAELCSENVLCKTEYGYMLKSDSEFHRFNNDSVPRSIYAIHRNDILYKANAHLLKSQFEPLYDGLEYDHEPLQYLLIDGKFRGVSVGHFRNGPYDLNDVVLDMSEEEAMNRMDEIIAAIEFVNFGQAPKRFMGTERNMNVL